MKVYGINLDNYDYLKLPENAINIRHTIDETKYCEQKKSVRKIWHKVKYDPFETAQIEALEEALRNEKFNLDDEWNRSDTLKMLYTSGFDIKQAIKNSKKYLRWRADIDTKSLTPEKTDI